MNTLIEQIRFCSENKLNFLLEGEAGVGKTMQVKQVWNEMFGDAYQYFSCPTLDPYIDLKGVPRESKKTGNLEFITPGWHNKVKAIFFDEIGRCGKIIKNAMMEVIQFRTINGIALPNLQVIGAATNPFDDEGTYDVERLDPAHLDRFHCHIQVPYDVSDDFFVEYMGDKELGKNVCTWWRELGDVAPLVQKKVSPRRLEYAMQVYKLGGDIRLALPKEAGLDKLQRYLNSGPAYFKLLALLKAKKDDEVRAFLKVENNYASCIPHIRKDSKVLKQVLPILQPEKLASVMVEDKKIKDMVIDNPGKFNEQFTALMGPNVSEDFKKSVDQKFKNNPEYCEKLYKETGYKVLNEFYVIQPGQKPDEFPVEKAKKFAKKFDQAKADKLFEDRAVQVAIEYNLDQKSEFYKKEFMPLLTAPGVANRAFLYRLMSLFCISICNIEPEELPKMEEYFPDCVGINNYMFQQAKEIGELDPLIKENFGSALLLIAELDWPELSARLNITGVKNGELQVV